MQPKTGMGMGMWPTKSKAHCHSDPSTTCPVWFQKAGVVHRQMHSNFQLHILGSQAVVDLPVCVGGKGPGYGAPGAGRKRQVVFGPAPVIIWLWNGVCSGVGVWCGRTMHGGRETVKGQTSSMPGLVPGQTVWCNHLVEVKTALKLVSAWLGGC